VEQLPAVLDAQLDRCVRLERLETGDRHARPAPLVGAQEAAATLERRT
jgi:hypothetical protein